MEIALGAVAEELLGKILEIKDKIFDFKEDFEQLKNTLEDVIPRFKQGMQLDLELNDRKWTNLEQMIDKLEKGKELVQKCSKVSSWDIFSKTRYSSNILSLNESILRFCQRELQIDTWCDSKKLLIENHQTKLRLGKVEEKLEGLIDQMGRTTVVGVPVAVGSSSSSSNEGLFSVPGLPDRVVGFGIAVRELKIELFKEDVTVLGLCAPGGCGKSTLASMLCRDEEVTGIFKDKIFFLTVSSTPNLEILHELREKIGGGVIGSNLSDETVTRQFEYLMKQRKSEPLLLVLDDVWDESIIKKFFYRKEGYKILITSRQAFQGYNLEYHSKYLLKTLSHDDSVTLFRHTALSHVRNESYKPDEDLLNKIVRCCDGFPVAITLIANSLSRQPAPTWRTVARKLSEGANILDEYAKLRELLATSLVSLDDKVRECFMDLGSFPEDERILVSTLIDIWCELYELEYEDEAYVNLLELASRNLVNLVGNRKIEEEIDDCFNEQFVTQHDLLRDLAIYQSRLLPITRLIMDKREKGLPKSWRGRENQYLNARLVSLNTDDMCSESRYDLQLPEAEVLILNFSASDYALPPFMEKMKKLKVLIIVNHGRTHAKISSWKTLGELANLKRIRLEKVSIPSLDEFAMPLRNLTKISLVTCEVGQALMQCTVNASHVLPNLVEFNIDYCDDLVELPPWICDIICLQKLRITNCHNLCELPEKIGNITELDLLRLHACTGLSKIPESIGLLQKLRLLDISDCYNLKMLPDEMCELRCLKKLDMRGYIGLMELPPSAMNLVHLKEVICDEDTASLWDDIVICGEDTVSLQITVPEKDINLDWLFI